MRRKDEVERLQKEQERLMKALLEMNSTEAATQRRADREKQKLIEKMNKQEDIRVRNERVKEKKLKELQYDLKRNGTDLVLEGFDSDDEDEVDNTMSPAEQKIAKENAAEERKRRHQEREAKQGAFAVDLGDADEGDPILAIPPAAYTNDKEYFLHTRVDEAAKQGRLIPSRAQIGYYKPWEDKPEKKQSFVPSIAARRIMPQSAEDCPKPPVVVYDDVHDEFMYMSHEDYEDQQRFEKERIASTVAAREREDLLAAAKAKRQKGPNFAEMDDESGAKESELPPIRESWTDNVAEVPLARARTAIRSVREVKLEKARFSVTDSSLF